jgi:hypothetical protein
MRPSLHAFYLPAKWFGFQNVHVIAAKLLLTLQMKIERFRQFIEHGMVAATVGLEFGDVPGAR